MQCDFIEHQAGVGQRGQRQVYLGVAEGHEGLTVWLTEGGLTHLQREREWIEQNQLGIQLAAILVLQESMRQAIEYRQQNQHAAGEVYGVGDDQAFNGTAHGSTSEIHRETPLYDN